MNKVKQKISGCFRSFESAKIFCCIRCSISAKRKQGFTSLAAFDAAFMGLPLPLLKNSYATCKKYGEQSQKKSKFTQAHRTLMEDRSKTPLLQALGHEH